MRFFVTCWHCGGQGPPLYIHTCLLVATVCKCKRVAGCLSWGRFIIKSFLSSNRFCTCEALCSKYLFFRRSQYMDFQERSQSFRLTWIKMKSCFCIYNNLYTLFFSVLCVNKIMFFLWQIWGAGELFITHSLICFLERHYVTPCPLSHSYVIGGRGTHKCM